MPGPGSYRLKSCDYAGRMETTETATCRYCHQTITRVVPAPFAVLVEGAQPAPWAGADGLARCRAEGGAVVAHEPEHPTSL